MRGGLIMGVLLVSLVVFPVLVPMCYAKPTPVSGAHADVPDAWGKIFSMDCKAYHEYYHGTNSSVYMPLIVSYRVFGIGVHYIEVNWSYSVLSYDDVWSNGSYSFIDSLYFELKPIIAFNQLLSGSMPWKLVAKDKLLFPTDGNIKHAVWSVDILVDGQKHLNASNNIK